MTNNMTNEKVDDRKVFYKDLLKGLYLGEIETGYDIITLLCRKYPKLAIHSMDLLKKRKFPKENEKEIEHSDKELDALSKEVEAFIRVQSTIKDIGISSDRRQALIAGIISMSSKELLKSQIKK